MGHGSDRSTVEELIDEHKVILDSFLVELSEVALAQAHKPIQEFEYKRSIGITLRHRHNVDIFVFDMAECR